MLSQRSFFEIDEMGTRYSFELKGKSELHPRSSSASLRHLNTVPKKLVKFFFFLIFVLSTNHSVRLGPDPLLQTTTQKYFLPPPRHWKT